VDLVVVHAQSAAGKNEADLLHLSYFSVTFVPWCIPWDDPARPLYKRIGYRAFDGLVSLVTTLPLNRLRKRQGLPPVGPEGFTSARLNLVPVSPAVYPPTRAGLPTTTSRATGSPKSRPGGSRPPSCWPFSRVGSRPWPSAWER
jgi:hypothetical protein